ncbi:MAG: hypothetical protein IMZ62_15875 [Chloroflexi bacterium]|nr:hypothetical protein [Chloroflexota bacterium]
MRLWILRPREFPFGNQENPWDPWYDRAFGFLVRAEDEQEARKLADEEAGDEKDLYQFPDRQPWTDSKYSTCDELLSDGVAEVLMQDFHAA